ncbi:hypothetical protein ABQJ54_12540 [Rhodanobacter sp. Si-c]|uniref:Uncharacterized protein n=1 Tax=Rhodanobacter lycopersici TaxID=3162487 RepID=A0ABV3QFG2_9GAMM
MKILTVCVAAALAVSGATCAYAADDSAAVVTRDFTDTVAPAQQATYEAGEKAWNECLRQHGFKYNVVALQHATGNTYTYAYEIGPYTWADFDEMHSTEDACDATVRSQLNPHLKMETSNFFVDRPDMSHVGPGGLDAWRKPGMPFIDVVAVTLNPGRAANEAFMSALKKIAAANTKTKSTVYYRVLTVQAGGEDAPDYVWVFPRKSWADYGVFVNSSLRKMLESAYGNAEADAILKSLESSIAKESEHIDSSNAGLSYIAGK